uniref:HAT C-terminal dimerisation domain-containing protein n=1 Tax=Ditylenchus dipsaci TaxID=166011 RepID=A0A915DBD9_9BILA
MGDAKMRCNECQQLVAKYTTSMKSHWVKKHKDKNQPAKKIQAEVNSELSEPKDKYKRIQSALAAPLSIPALPINSFLHPLMRKLFHSLNSNYELPRSFATLKIFLLDQYVKTQSKMKADLSTMRQRFSITCDTRNTLDSTLGQVLVEMAAENRNARDQRRSQQPGVMSWIRQTLNKVNTASSVGVEPLKLWANMLKTDAKNIAILALEVLSIPATSAPIERIFSQAGLASSKHRNRTSFDLLNSQLVVYCNV